MREKVVNEGVNQKNGRTPFLNLESIFSWLVFFFFCLSIVLRDNNLWNVYDKLNYVDILVSDWLINFEGGFVRRGLVGQFLFESTRFYLFDVRLLIVVMVAVSSFVMLLLLIRIFRREGWAVLIIPTGCCLGFTFMNMFCRRDFISLLLTFLIFYSYRHYVFVKKQNLGVSFYVLSIVQILVHEAAFFYTFPILFIDYYLRENTNLTLSRRLIACGLRFSPILILMLLVGICHGSQSIVVSIWESWKEVFRAYPDGTDSQEIGVGLQYLLMSFWSAAKYHLSASYKGGLNPEYWRCLFVLFNFLSVYYLLTRISIVNMRLFKPKKMDHFFMSSIVIVQFIGSMLNRVGRYLVV